MSELRIADTVEDSITDGEGLRFTIFVQGCPHHCDGCHNPTTHDFNGGKIVDTDELFDTFKNNVLLSGVTFSGGEPMCQAKPLLDLARRIRTETDMNITIFTGYTLEELINKNDPIINELLSLTYMLIDGKFDIDKRDLTLTFRGSSNQRLIKYPLQAEMEILQS